MKKLLFFLSAVTLLSTASCKGDKNNNGVDNPQNPPRTQVPDEFVGAWENGSIDFNRWENYSSGYWAGQSAVASREAMVFQKNGDAKFYRYEHTGNLYEELIDCTGTVTFNGDGTFTFYPVQGRIRTSNTTQPLSEKPLTSAQLASSKLKGTRGYSYDPSNSSRIQITVPSSAPYYWYRKS